MVIRFFISVWDKITCLFVGERGDVTAKSFPLAFDKIPVNTHSIFDKPLLYFLRHLGK